MLDFHTHLLPKIDDGSRSLEETQSILEKQQAQESEVVVATPHFYPNQELSIFLEERQSAYHHIESVNGIESLEIRMGAEVLLSVDTPMMDNLGALAIEGTPYILVELYMGVWSEWVYIALQEIKERHQLIPMIAHVERYDVLASTLEPLNRLMDIGVVFQVNTQSLHPKSRKRQLIKRLINRGLVHAIGSDVHREQQFISVKQGYQWIEKCYGKKQVEQIQTYSQQLLEGKAISCKEVKPFKKFLWFWY